MEDAELGISKANTLVKSDLQKLQIDDINYQLARILQNASRQSVPSLDADQEQVSSDEGEQEYELPESQSQYECEEMINSDSN